MADLKEIFNAAENGTLTYEQFVEACKASGAKFKDVSSGDYVSKQKYEDDLAAKTTEIETLNGTITTRDTDLESLKKQLEEAGTNGEKLDTLAKNLEKLQTKYDNDVKAYQEQLQKQAYNFAVDRFADSLEFSSEAAKRDFVQQMHGANLTMEGDKLIGATDFKEAYATNNADAFKVATPAPQDDPKPQFVAPALGTQDNPAQMTLTELMEAKNANPELSIHFED